MVTLENYEEYMLLDADGELDASGQQALRSFLKLHPALKQEHELYLATRLVPDATITYTGKQALMKPGPQPRTIPLHTWWMAGAAACIGLLVYVFVARTSMPVQQLAHNKPKKTAPVVLHTSPVQPPVHHSRPPAQVAAAPAVADAGQHTATPSAPAQLAVAHTAAKQDMLLKTGITQDDKTTDLPQHELVTIAVIEASPVAVLDYELPRPAIAAAVSLPALPGSEPVKKMAILDDDRVNGIKELEYALNEKVKNVKNIRNRVKDTDVLIKLGNRELITLKF